MAIVPFVFIKRIAGHFYDSRYAKCQSFRDLKAS